MRLFSLLTAAAIFLFPALSAAQSVQFSVQLVLTGSYQLKSAGAFQNNLGTPQLYNFTGETSTTIITQDVFTTLSEAYYLQYQKPLTLNQRLPVGLDLISTDDGSPYVPYGIASEYMSNFQNVATSGQSVSTTGSVQMSWQVAPNSWTDFYQLAFYGDDGGDVVSTSFINVPHGTQVNNSAVKFTVYMSQTYSLFSTSMMGNPTSSTYDDGTGHGLVTSIRFWWHDGWGTTIDGLQASYADGTSPSHCTGGQCPGVTNSAVGITTSDPIQSVTVYYSSVYVDSIKIQLQSGTVFIAGCGCGDFSQSFTIPTGYYLYRIAGSTAPWGWGSNMLASIQFGFTQQLQI